MAAGATKRSGRLYLQQCTTGSGQHKGEKCTYTISGTYDVQTGVTKLRFAGTLTR